MLVRNLAVLLLLLLAYTASASLDYSRVHLVDHNADTGNFLFRSNFPKNSSGGFAYDELVEFLGKRAAEASLRLPASFYLVDVSLMNVFEKDFYIEDKFWADSAHAQLGRMNNWPLGIAGILPPSLYNETTQRRLAAGYVWKVDQIPTRVAELKTWLDTKQDKPWVLLVHCEAGCDRTGEVIGSYRMANLGFNTTDMYAHNVAECGRPPNYWSTTAQEWFCVYYEDKTGKDIGDCMGFAKCKFAGDCTPVTGDTAPMLDIADTHEPQLNELWHPTMDHGLISFERAASNDEPVRQVVGPQGRVWSSTLL